MRYLFRGLVAAAALGMIGQVVAASSPLGLTIDLLAPATPCSSAGCPSDIDLPIFGVAPLGSSTFSYGPPQAPNSASSFGYLASVGLDNGNPATYPVVCDESPAPTSTVGFTTTFSNATNSGGLLAFGGGGTNPVDLSSLAYSNASGTPGLGLIYNNTSTRQVTCYPALPIGSVASGATAPVLASNGTVAGDRIFAESFENPVSAGAGEPWVSALTAISPTSTGGSNLVYVLQIHNADKANGWHVDFGYDTPYFGTSTQWCVIGSSYPQPGAIPQLSCSLKPVTSNPTYSVSGGDIQSATNSVYLQVLANGTSAATSNFSSVPATFYPALGTVFPPAGSYPQRLDNKVAVASANNMPVQSVGSIVCANTIPTACTVYDTDGNRVGNLNSSSGNLTQAQLNIAYTVSGGTVSLNPVAYFVSPSGSNTLPASNPPLASNGTFKCPSPILSNSTLSTTGAALGFTFAPQTGGGAYVPGTATCTATFTTGMSSPFALSDTQTFPITMSPSQVTQLVVSAPSTATVGSAVNGITVTAEDPSGNTVSTYNGTVHFSSTDPSASLPADVPLTNGVGTFSATFKTAGTQAITATDTVTSAITGTSGIITVQLAPAVTFAVSALSPQTHGTPFQVSVTAKDQYGNTATGYNGTVHFTSTDSNAVLPPDQTLSNGIITPFPQVTLNTVGTQTITVTDKSNSSLAGVSNNITVN